jgi:hypothetical protein
MFFYQGCADGVCLADDAGGNIFFAIPVPGGFPEITLIPHRSGQRRSRELFHICSNEPAGTFASTGDLADRN